MIRDLIRIHKINMSYSMQKNTVLVLDMIFLILMPFEMSMKKVSLVSSVHFPRRKKKQCRIRTGTYSNALNVSWQTWIYELQVQRYQSIFQLLLKNRPEGKFSSIYLILTILAERTFLLGAGGWARSCRYLRKTCSLVSFLLQDGKNCYLFSLKLKIYCKERI